MRLQRAMTHLPAPSDEPSTALAPPQGFIQRQYCALSVEANSREVSKSTLRKDELPGQQPNRD